jgi:hypothetical protein
MRDILKTPLKEGFPGAVNISGSFVDDNYVCMNFDMYVKTETILDCIDQFNESPGSIEEKSKELYSILWMNIHITENSIYDFGKALLNFICSTLNDEEVVLCKEGGASKINFIMDIYVLECHQITVTSSKLKGWYIPNYDYLQIYNYIDFKDYDFYFTLPTRLEFLDSNERYFIFEIIKVLRSGIDSTCNLSLYQLQELLQKDNKMFSFYDKYLIEWIMEKFGRLGLTENLNEYCVGDPAVFYDIELYEYYFSDIFNGKAA